MTDARGNKPWLKTKTRSRVATIIESKRTFLVLCEGQTEADYFLAFNDDTVAVTAENLGCTMSALVECAVKYRDAGSYDEVWCVYDLDYNPSEGNDQHRRFQESLDYAERQGISVAYSIDAFELWFRLHYEAVTGPIHRRQLYEDLSKRWEMNYSADGKHHSFTRTVKQRLEDDLAADVYLAIERAEKLFASVAGLPVRERNPATTVYRLVGKLLESSQ